MAVPKEAMPNEAVPAEAELLAEAEPKRTVREGVVPREAVL